MKKAGRTFKLLLGLALLGLILPMLYRNLTKLPDAPRELILNKHNCAYCKMHISDLRFASQIQTKDKGCLFFDDHGCLFLYQAVNEPNVHAIYYRHIYQEEWIPEKDTLFVEIEESPMGFNLGTIRFGEGKGMEVEKAKDKIVKSKKIQKQNE